MKTAVVLVALFAFAAADDFYFYYSSAAPDDSACAAASGPTYVRNSTSGDGAITVGYLTGTVLGTSGTYAEYVNSTAATKFSQGCVSGECLLNTNATEDLVAGGCYPVIFNDGVHAAALSFYLKFIGWKTPADVTAAIGALDDFHPYIATYAATGATDRCTGAYEVVNLESPAAACIIGATNSSLWTCATTTTTTSATPATKAEVCAAQACSPTDACTTAPTHTSGACADLDSHSFEVLCSKGTVAPVTTADVTTTGAASALTASLAMLLAAIVAALL